MMVIRPIRADDYPALYQMAVESGHGFTSLPVNDELLMRKISRSEQSLQKKVSSPGDEGYLFVLEDTSNGDVCGTSALEAAVGLDDAFYHYHLGKVVHSSRSLGVYKTVDILTLCNDYTGVSELCTLFLRENRREKNNGRLLSKSRFLFMAEFAERFADRVIAEMRGVSDQNGHSPFWRWLQEHFFSVDFPTADYLTGIGQKVFIAELMPKYPIYVSLLSKQAQQVIGKVHDKTRPALALLQSEGFSNRGYVDIFDAGPTVEARVEHIRSIRYSRKLQVQIGTPGPDSQPYLICNTNLEQFRATWLALTVTEHSDQVVLPQDCADALGVKAGEHVRLTRI
ncbi:MULTISPECIES: arginine N-succinyltransferase [unclassified Arsukibacterium]|uniref:arginine N-succinyltransferase n=1 Tax=unclassified Arsukibacterium TaxID=2635278 RepID=UPI000C3F3AB4|nr:MULTISPECIES: arginine N-succinyltransferase [unclassified Arsukibacterium]MAA96016.1 arginine N-succinyltransferase [Rheinheimera sp.]MBM34311.1 arginine N-succinyltransferase [Rheinheimera sp.]HAW92301.1 arginine N-succinyltransferase [Candidatus Azambacteria bacterium]|tara:strand:+ start:24611 stop:25630 length:1020 start_codon:yes stop_codon:yes gene_type:complete